MESAARVRLRRPQLCLSFPAVTRGTPSLRGHGAAAANDHGMKMAGGFGFNTSSRPVAFSLVALELKGLLLREAKGAARGAVRWVWHGAERAQLRSQLCCSTSAKQVLVVAKGSQEFIGARPETRCFPFVRGLEESGSKKKIQNTDKCVRQTD